MRSRAFAREPDFRGVIALMPHLLLDHDQIQDSESD